ncbi:hypothetical protein LY90DRAFT_675205 [Neocallimastix californiae]|uniref:CBM6 domain-containing protein n=1 Tax=Neocallimastix californiae TaxID=1754190 RepID=A0A1Y2APD1_9FUNG|nr:hypothetical protein LY90DRAFT_675205 [Neocallimastix californiae]|eukprot:ORY24423.1 hypothetical protein LY90DRAFT_675205 [Neocallimastix californiae]
MKLYNLFTLTASLLSIVSASYYKASRMTYYGGPGDEDSVKDPFCQDYSSKVDKYLTGVDYYVAITAEILSKSNASSYCGKKIKISNAETGRSLTALVVDKCHSCGYGNIDLSVEAFRYLSRDHLSQGVLRQASWCIVDGPSKFACPSSSSSSTSSSSSSSSSTVSAGGIYIQLEKGTRHGDVSKRYDIKYYSGSGYIYIGSPYSKSGTRSSVAAKVDLRKSGKYNIIIKYNNSSSSSKENRIVVNDSNVYKVKFGKTGSEWKKLTIEGVRFKSGENIIQVRATDVFLNYIFIFIYEFPYKGKSLKVEINLKCIMKSPFYEMDFLIICELC